MRRGEVLLSPCSFCILSVIWRRIFMESFFVVFFLTPQPFARFFPICKCWGLLKGVVEVITEDVPGLSVPSVLPGLHNLRVPVALECGSSRKWPLASC